MTFFFVCFLIKFGSRKLFFGLTFAFVFLLSIQYFNALQFGQTFFDNMFAFCPVQNQQIDAKAFFMNATKTNKTFC